MIYEPSVKLIAHTNIIPDWAADDLFDLRTWIGDMEIEGFTEEADALAEFAGRSCYQSFHKPNEATRENKDYLANILRQGHESVLEHASATFYIEGVSRALTHELIRHRHLSYSQLSQRFVDESESEDVIPPAVAALGYGDEKAIAVTAIGALSRQAGDSYETLVKILERAGYPRKQAREAARAVLPNMTETKIVVTGNMRAWRDFLKKRHTLAADAEIRKVAGLILAELRQIAPASFQDIPEEVQ